MKTKSILKIIGKTLFVILLLAMISLPVWFGWTRNTYYNQQTEQKETVTILGIDSTVTQEVVPSPTHYDGSNTFEVTNYIVTYKDSTGTIYNRIPVIDTTIPKLGPAQIIKKRNHIVWLQNTKQ